MREEEEDKEEKMTFTTAFDDDTTTTTTTKTAYERERDERVRRNEAVMRRLGLHSFDVRAHHFSNTKEKKKRKKRQKPTTVGGGGTRRTRRTVARGRDEDDDVNDEKEEEEEEEEEEREEVRDEEKERKHCVAEREFVLRHKNKQKTRTIVGTASYQHTLMRVRTMTEPKLRNRMKAISRAKGQHCVTKMRLFARILFLEGYEELAEECAEELKQLIDILGDAHDDETREVEEDEEHEEPEEEEDKNNINKENEEKFHCGQATNLDDPMIFKCVVDIESHARTNEKKGEKDEDVYHRACVSLSKGESGMLNKTVAFVLNDDASYDVIAASEKELNALKTKNKTKKVVYY